MKNADEKIGSFFKKALDVMFRAVGFSGFDEDFAKQKDWYSRREWSAQQREDFRKWFVVNAKKDLRWPKRVAEKEFSFFDLMWGWREREGNHESRGS